MQVRDDLATNQSTLLGRAPQSALRSTVFDGERHRVSEVDRYARIKTDARISRSAALGRRGRGSGGKGNRCEEATGPLLKLCAGKECSLRGGGSDVLPPRPTRPPRPCRPAAGLLHDAVLRSAYVRPGQAAAAAFRASTWVAELGLGGDHRRRSIHAALFLRHHRVRLCYV